MIRFLSQKKTNLKTWQTLHFSNKRNQESRSPADVCIVTNLLALRKATTKWKSNIPNQSSSWFVCHVWGPGTKTNTNAMDIRMLWILTDYWAPRGRGNHSELNCWHWVGGNVRTCSEFSPSRRQSLQLSFLSQVDKPMCIGSSLDYLLCKRLCPPTVAALTLLFRL